MTPADLIRDGELAQYHRAEFVSAPHAAVALRAQWDARGAVWLGAWTSTAWPNIVFGALQLDPTRTIVLSAVGDDVVCDLLSWFPDGMLLYTTSLEYALDLKPFGVVHQKQGTTERDALQTAHDERLERMATLCGDPVELGRSLDDLLQRLDPLYARILARAQADAKKQKKPEPTRQ